MIRLQGLTEAELKAISRQITDAYFDYEYNPEDRGLFIFLTDREKMFTYMDGIVQAGYRSGILYATSENREGFLMYTGRKGPSVRFSEGIRMIFAMKKALGGWRNLIRFMKTFFCDGGTLETRMRKAKRDYLKIEMLVVRSEYQKKGHMRRMMNYVIEEAEKLGVPVILETDDRDKCARYVSCGMETDRVRKCGERLYIYDLIRPASR